MKGKLSHQFFRGYLTVFLLTLLATALAFVMLSLAGQLISGTLAKSRFPAEVLIRPDYRQINPGPVVENGGGVQIVDRDYRVLSSSGLDLLGKAQLSPGEFADFLTESKGRPYHIDVLYEPQGEFWLIVTFPTSLRLDFALAYNPDGAPGDFRQVGMVLIGVGLVYCALLALIALAAARLAASGVTVPLRKLIGGTRLLREGDYSARVELRLKNEFAQLQDTFNDMAERIEEEMALRKKSESDRRQLIADISHDLKNPLSSILGYAERCLDNPELPPEVRQENLQIIHRNGKRANLLLSELFELSQLDSPAFSMRLAETDLAEYLRQFCAELLPQLEQAGFGYAFDIPEELFIVPADPLRLGRLLQNLAENALRHNRPGTTVSLSLTAQENRALIRFADDGAGIPAHLAQDIFKPFVRADASRSADTGGSGLGLSIAKKIAQAHGGDLILLPEGPGSVFLLELPGI